MEEQAKVLKGAGDTLLGNGCRRKTSKVFVSKKDFSRIRVVNARNAVEYGSLPGTVGTDDDQDLLLLYLKIDIRQGLNATKTDGQFFKD